jgi:hypothetical protein
MHSIDMVYLIEDQSSLHLRNSTLVMLRNLIAKYRIDLRVICDSGSRRHYHFEAGIRSQLQLLEVVRELQRKMAIHDAASCSLFGAL